MIYLALYLAVGLGVFLSQLAPVVSDLAAIPTSWRHKLGRILFAVLVGGTLDVIAWPITLTVATWIYYDRKRIEIERIKMMANEFIKYAGFPRTRES